MNVKCALTILFAITIESGQSVIADKGKFEITKPSQIDQLPDERRLVNFKESPNETKDKDKSETTDSEKDKDSRQEKKTRTILPSPSSTDSADNPRCCGSRYDSTSSSQGSSSGLRSTSDTGRYLPSRYGSRPEDRFGWQSYNPGSSGRRGSTGSSPGFGSGGGGLYGSSQSGGDRYGTRPSYYGGGSDYDRPNGNRPIRPSYNNGGSGYGDNGAYGSNGYEISRPGGSYGNRPPGGINFGGGRPGGGGYGGGPGIYGTIGEENEFPGQEEGPEGGPPQPSGVNNLNTQKAVALKALAGVALIGAAAALATNPVLLPIGVLAGRKKRSVISSLQIEEVDANTLMKLLEAHVPKIYREKLKPELFESPTCVARLACEIQQRYEGRGENNDNDEITVANVYERLKTHLGTLIRSKVLDVDILYKNLKRLVKSAAVYDGNCNVFVCDFTKS